MLSGSGRSSFTPGLDCCSHASAFSNEFLCFYEHVLQVPSCWVLACVWACSVTATAKLNKQLGNETGSLGLCATGIPERMGTNLILGEWESIQLQDEFNEWKLLLCLDSTGCQLFSVSAWQSSPAPNIWHATFSSFLTFTPAFDCASWSHHWFLWLLPGVPLWFERWMPFPNLLPQAVDEVEPLSDKHY